ncbi:sigma 54-interacting transcriptional regulator [Sorangium sp. So ce296]|uniref:sigma-54-dependent transcriptional regulator n=1 Tax=Sorangium sp. So ce296 TaxID=3133296 RepID=UPI003F5FB353
MTVSRDEIFTALVPRLVSATYFEEAATAVLQAMFACVEEALADGPLASRARILRGVVHLRPEGTYQRLFGIDRASGARIEGTGYLTSGSVWSWIEQHRCSVSIDVQRASIRSWMRDGAIELRDPSEAAGVPGDATRKRMLDRDATHVHVVPLRAPGGSVDGMITLEASCRGTAGRELPWAECHEGLEILASIAGAFIAARALPLRSNEPASPDEFLPVVGQSTAHLVELLRAFAPRDDTILITGPTGAGKSRLARWCHEHSQRRGQPFESLDLLGVPEDLQMAELFGWKRGAFTGAVKDNPGAVARAAKGTLFLDEIDKLSLKAQAGLLRFIEERAYRMLGDDGAGERRADARLLVGTNADLRAAVRAGRFREDLYYRINVLPVRLLPLAERLDELPRWAEYMLNRRHQEADGKGAARFEPEAMKLLVSAPWPGNLRQLDNIVRRAYALQLAGQSGLGGDLVIQRRHVERALTFDGDAEPSALVKLLWRAALSFVSEAERRRGGGAPLPLELTDAFRGMVLGAAVQRTGNRDDAFTLLGQEPLLKNRNHHRALRRELSRVREVLDLLGGEVDPDLLAVLDADKEP